MFKKVLGTSLLGALALVGLGAVEASADTLYTVNEGDTLSEISQAFVGDASLVEAIASSNKLENVNLIFPGQELNIPAEGQVAVATENYTEPVQEEVYVGDYIQEVVVPQESVTYATGGDGSVAYASQRMADATGVSADYWNWIIMAESGGSSTISNPTGHYGYFQISPIHGMPQGADVDTQIDYAINIYNSQGLGAWEVTH